MKMEMRMAVKPIETIRKSDVEEINTEEVQIFLDDKRAPKTLETLILLGLEVSTKKYCKSVEEMMVLDQKLLEGK